VNKKLLLGVKVTKGKGSAYPEVGEFVAEQSKDAIEEILDEADIVLILGNIGGGTGAGVIPVIAEIARENGALVICIVSKPFSFEGEERQINASECMKKLKGVAHTVLILENDSMLEHFSNLSIDEVFLVLDRVALKIIKKIVDSINQTFTKSLLLEIENLLKSEEESKTKTSL
jgi:cell division protein FtsZ